jgi:hypothetical protein
MVPTRLFVDAQRAEEWREKGFYSVTKGGDASLLSRMLELGRKRGLKSNGRLPDHIKLGFERKNDCPTLDEFKKYASEKPQEGMPLAVTGLRDDEYETIRQWVAEGAAMDEVLLVASSSEQAHIAIWEEFLNRQGKRERLVSRYLYEHLFLAHLYFEAGQSRRFFELVRSRTPSGVPIEILPSIRPTSDPEGAFFYRLRPIQGAIVYKTHITYSLGAEKLQRLEELFLGGEWQVKELPTYRSKDAINPFSTFAAIPAEARFRFLLDNAEFFIRTFIRGPVCRGQIGTDVIQDRFWVAFQNPSKDLFVTDREYARSQYDDLAMPGKKAGNNHLGPTRWIAAEQDYVKRRRKAYAHAESPGLDHLWDGDGWNGNALMTIFRNFDSATVKRGWIGDVPKTLWVVDFPLLERIYYQLVANFNVFGSLAHQTHTRLYFDLLRAEGEASFLRFLPKEKRNPLRKSWYKSLLSGIKLRLVYENLDLKQETRMSYRGEDARAEFVRQVLKHLSAVAGPPDFLNRCTSKPCDDHGFSAYQNHVEGLLQELVNHPALEARYISFMPEITFLRIGVGGGNRDLAYTLVRNREHLNVAFMVNESARLVPEKDQMTLVRGPMGSYPNRIFHIPAGELDTFVTSLQRVRSEAGFLRVQDAYGIRRMHPEFWDHFHFFRDFLLRTDPTEAGIFDMNRYENF